MAETKLKLNSLGTAIAITSADGNGDGVYSSSALVDNQTNLYMDALVGGSLQSGTVPAGGGTIDIWVSASWDGVDFTGGCTAEFGWATIWSDGRRKKRN